MESIEQKKAQLKLEIEQAHALLTDNIEHISLTAYIKNPLSSIPKIAGKAFMATMDFVTSFHSDRDQ